MKEFMQMEDFAVLHALVILRVRMYLKNLGYALKVILNKEIELTKI